MLTKLVSTKRSLIVSTILSVLVLIIGIVLAPVYSVFATVIITLATLAICYFGYHLVRYIVAKIKEKKEATAQAGNTPEAPKKDPVRLTTSWRDWIRILTILGVIAIIIILLCRGCGNNGTGHFENATFENATFKNVTADKVETEEVITDNIQAESADIEQITIGTADITDAFMDNSYTEYQHADELVTEELNVEPEVEKEEPIETPKEETKKEPVIIPETPKPVHTCNFKLEKKEATCTENGYTVEVCECGKERNRTVIDKVNHSWGSGKVTTAATEETDGVLTKKCQNCGTTTTETIAKLSHTHKIDAAKTKEEKATCEKDGYVKYYCACGKLMSQDTTSKTKHDWNEGKITRKPTEKRTGIKTYTCDACGEEKVEELEVLEHKHDYDWVVVEEATCGEDGLEEYICEDCGDVKRERTIDATDDCKYKEVDRKEPTATRDGYIKYECKYCGDSYKKTIPATGEEDEEDEEDKNTGSSKGDKVYLDPSSTSVASGEILTITTSGSSADLVVSYDSNVVEYKKISNNKITLKWFGTQNGMPAPTAISIYDKNATNKESMLDLIVVNGRLQIA